MAHTDTIKFMTKHLKRLPKATTPGQRNRVLHNWLVEYHQEECTDEQKYALTLNIVSTVYYLFPKFLKGKCSPQVHADDIAQIMVENTMQAIKLYNPALKTKFTSYLVGYLKNAIATAYREAHIIKNPSTVRAETISKLERLARGESDNNDPVTPEAMEQATNTLKKLPPQVVYLEDSLVELRNITTPNVLSSLNSDTTDAEGAMLFNEQIHLIAHLLSHDHPVLNAKEKLVLKHRFGVFGQEKLTLVAVAKKFHMRGWPATKEWVFQVENKALRKVAQHFALHKLL